MKSYPDAIITNEAVSLPFISFGHNFLISAFSVKDGSACTEFLSLHIGDISGDEPVIVRLHSGCVTGEVFQSVQCDCAWQLVHAIELIAKSSRGVLVYFPNHEGRGSGLVSKVKSFGLVDRGLTTAQAFTALGIPLDAREYAAGLTVLRRLGVRRMSLITNNPAKLEAARAFGFEVVSRIPSVMPTNDPSLNRYLESKRRDFGHLF